MNSSPRTVEANGAGYANLHFIGVEDRKRVQIAREKNHMRFRGRFQSVIEKYDRNFSNVGDEIDLETLEVAVDNGHLFTMRNDRDIGNVGSSRARKQPSQMMQSSHNELSLAGSPSTLESSQFSSFRRSKTKPPDFLNELDEYLINGASTKSDQVPGFIGLGNVEHASERAPNQNLGAQDTLFAGPSESTTPCINHFAIEELGKSIAHQISDFLQRHQLNSFAPIETPTKSSDDQDMCCSVGDSRWSVETPKIENSLIRHPPPHTNVKPQGHDQSIWSQSRRPGSPTPAHIFRQELPELSEEDKLIIRLKYKEDMKWSEIRGYFRTAEKFETARNRWYAQLSKRFPNDGRLKNRRHTRLSHADTSAVVPSGTMSSASSTVSPVSGGCCSSQQTQMRANVTPAKKNFKGSAAESHSCLKASLLSENIEQTPKNAYVLTPKDNEDLKNTKARKTVALAGVQQAHSRIIRSNTKAVRPGRPRKIHGSSKSKHLKSTSKSNKNSLTSNRSLLEEEDLTDELAF